MRMSSPWTLGSVQHGGRQEIGILGIKSSVRQRSARSSPPRRMVSRRFEEQCRISGTTLLGNQRKRLSQACLGTFVNKTRAVLSPGNCAKPCKLRYVKSVRNFMWKLCYRKNDRAMRPIRECPENFRDSLTTPTTTIPKFSWAFLPINPMNVPTKFEVRSFTRSWDNRGYSKNLGSPWIRPRSIFCKIFNGILFVMAMYIVAQKFGTIFSVRLNFIKY